jgi:hypothetical protein
MCLSNRTEDFDKNVPVLFECGQHAPFLLLPGDLDEDVLRDGGVLAELVLHQGDIGEVVSFDEDGRNIKKTHLPRRDAAPLAGDDIDQTRRPVSCRQTTGWMIPICLILRFINRRSTGRLPIANFFSMNCCCFRIAFDKLHGLW